jgi:hypothetical protein
MEHLAEAVQYRALDRAYGVVSEASSLCLQSKSAFMVPKT